MKVWVDGDACPKQVKEVIFKCAQNRKVPTVVVANSYQNLPRTPFISFVLVGKDFDAADHHICHEATPDDLVITADVPLAAELLALNIEALNPRGTIYTKESIGERIAIRNLSAELRSGLMNQGGGPASFSEKDKKNFAASFDREVTKRLKKSATKFSPEGEFPTKLPKSED